MLASPTLGQNLQGSEAVVLTPRYLCTVQSLLVGKEVEFVVFLGAGQYVDVIEALHCDTEVWLLWLDYFHNDSESGVAQACDKGRQELRGVCPKEGRKGGREGSTCTLALVESARSRAVVCGHSQSRSLNY